MKIINIVNIPNYPNYSIHGKEWGLLKYMYRIYYQMMK